MKRIGPIFFLLFFFPSLCFGAPAISFRNLSYDFGVVAGGETVKHVFDFANRGDQELIIQKLSPS